MAGWGWDGSGGGGRGEGGWGRGGRKKTAVRAEIKIFPWPLVLSAGSAWPPSHSLTLCVAATDGVPSCPEGHQRLRPVRRQHPFHRPHRFPQRLGEGDLHLPRDRDPACPGQSERSPRSPSGGVHSTWQHVRALHYRLSVISERSHADHLAHDWVSVFFWGGGGGGGSISKTLEDHLTPVTGTALEDGMCLCTQQKHLAVAGPVTVSVMFILRTKET